MYKGKREGVLNIGKGGGGGTQGGKLKGHWYYQTVGFSILQSISKFSTVNRTQGHIRGEATGFQFKPFGPGGIYFPSPFLRGTGEFFFWPFS